MKRLAPVLALAVFVAASSASLARADEQPPLIKHVPVAKANKGDAVNISAEMEDESEIFAPTLYFRYPGARGYSSVAMTRKGAAFVASVQATADVEYWIEAYDEFGNGPTREGSPDRPHRIGVAERAAVARVAPVPAPVPVENVPEPVAPPPAPDAFVDTTPAPPPPVAFVDVPPPLADAFLEIEEKPIYKEWWFIGTGAAVGAVIIVAGIIAAQPDPVYQNSFSASFKR